MIKLQFLIWAPVGMPQAGFAQLIREGLVPELEAHEPAQIKLTLTAGPPPKVSIIPFQRRGVALISLWEAEEERIGEWAERIEDRGMAFGERVGGYRVTEALPAAYERDWPNCQDTPGLCLLTLLRRKRGMDDAELFERWHGGHTPLTLRTHPVWCYVRNAVDEPVIAGSPLFDGIVEEHFRCSAELLNPAIFFGGPHRTERPALKGLPAMVPNMVKVGLDIGSFLDMGSLETYLTTERWVKS